MRIGIIGAMQTEVSRLKNSLTDLTVRTIAGLEIAEGLLGSVPCAVVQSGIGKINAAMCTQILIDCVGVTHVINTGIAGLLDDFINVGDIVVSTDCMSHDMDVTALGYKRGQVPGLPVRTFEADAELRSLALASGKRLFPELNVVAGRVTSGDAFVHEYDVGRHLMELGGFCCEMEGAAIAQVCWLNKVPFVVVRTLSDRPGDSKQVENYEEFEAEAADRSARLVLDMVERLP